MQRKSSLAKSKDGQSYIFLLSTILSKILLGKVRGWSILSTIIVLTILYDQISSLYFPPLFHLRLPRVDQIAGFDSYPISTFLKSLWVAVRLNIIVRVSHPH